MFATESSRMIRKGSRSFFSNSQSGRTVRPRDRRSEVGANLVSLSVTKHHIMNSSSSCRFIAHLRLAVVCAVGSTWTLLSANASHATA
ncbi:hypothetical protein K469DRAFT_60751 [Zopfia rhizophila CBS 207.26]|uniref:Uncharacterized protein n=1 Tax=Zopfia rhizophila CBS 207.26 TaxID=1314779 RepID=A0A6A6EBT0_9PEZI|nr:hypothetical protein K469DRAFT_60751 [Zopfia rhizophila CBS 207.26]